MQTVDVIEFRRNLVAKEPTCTSWGNRPRVYIFRIAPDQITKGAFVGDLLGSSDDADLVQGAYFGRQAAVNAEDLAVNNGGKGQEVKDLAAGLPDRGVAVLCLTLFVEAIDLGDLSRFVVPSYQGDSVGKSARDDGGQR